MSALLELIKEVFYRHALCSRKKLDLINQVVIDLSSAEVSVHFELPVRFSVFWGDYSLKSVHEKMIKNYCAEERVGVGATLLFSITNRDRPLIQSQRKLGPTFRDFRTLGVSPFVMRYMYMYRFCKYVFVNNWNKVVLVMILWLIRCFTTAGYTWQHVGQL